MDHHQLFTDVFKSMPHDLRKEILSQCKFVELNRGHILLDYGQSINVIPLVVSGIVKVLRTDEQGKELLVYYINPGETCALTLTSTLRKETSTVKAITQTKCLIATLGVNTLFALRAKHLSWNDYMVQSYAHRIQEIMGLVDDLGFHHVNHRIEKYLKDRAHVFNSRALQLSHQEIANDLGTSREVISRHLKKMENEGRLVLSRERIKLRTL